MEFPQIKFDEKGLVPAVVQDIKDGAVLMVAYINKEALELTLTTGFATFYSRSRKKLWKKGEESGNVLRVKEIFYDCDGDCILIKAEPAGPTCHTGNRTC